MLEIGTPMLDMQEPENINSDAQLSFQQRLPFSSKAVRETHISASVLKPFRFVAKP